MRTEQRHGAGGGSAVAVPIRGGFQIPAAGRRSILGPLWAPVAGRAAPIRAAGADPVLEPGLRGRAAVDPGAATAPGRGTGAIPGPAGAGARGKDQAFDR